MHNNTNPILTAAEAGTMCVSPGTLSRCTAPLPQKRQVHIDELHTLDAQSLDRALLPVLFLAGVSEGLGE